MRKSQETPEEEKARDAAVIALWLGMTDEGLDEVDFLFNNGLGCDVRMGPRNGEPPQAQGK